MIRPGRVIKQVRRAVATKRVRAALAGRGKLPPISLEHDSNGIAEALADLLQGVSHRSPLLHWVRVELEGRRTIDHVIDCLNSPISSVRIRSSRLAGALRLEQAVPWLGRLLAHKDSRVQEGAARSLGMIRGARSADALVRSLFWRRGATMRIVLELSRAAPDHYIESALLAPAFADVRVHLLLALGLRGGKTGVPPLLEVHDSGARGERVARCRALGWIGDRRGIPTLEASLGDPSRKVRASAVKALARIGEASCAHAIEPLLADREPEVRAAAEIALRRLDPTLALRGHAPPVRVIG